MTLLTILSCVKGSVEEETKQQLEAVVKFLGEVQTTIGSLLQALPRLSSLSYALAT